MPAHTLIENLRWYRNLCTSWGFSFSQLCILHLLKSLALVNVALSLNRKVSKNVHSLPASGTNMQSWHVGWSHRGAYLNVSGNGEDVTCCDAKHSKRSSDLVFLSHVLQLWCLHEACYGSFASRYPQQHLVSAGAGHRLSCLLENFHFNVSDDV